MIIHAPATAALLQVCLRYNLPGLGHGSKGGADVRRLLAACDPLTDLVGLYLSGMAADGFKNLTTERLMSELKSLLAYVKVGGWGMGGGSLEMGRASNPSALLR